MSENRVLIIGAGIAGPVLAVFMKERGFEPVIFESHYHIVDLGLSLALQTNGLKVLNLIPGLMERLPGINTTGVRLISLVQDKVLVSTSEVPVVIRGVVRSELHRLLIDFAVEKGVKINWGYKLERIEQSDSDVTAFFANGEKAFGSFAIGCDGLHSVTRTCLFGREEPIYTGLTQVGGFSKAPKEFLENGPCFYNFYGEEAHIVAYHPKKDTVSWAITRREPENKESWRSVDADQEAQIRNSDAAHWKHGAGELVQGASKYIKYGLYDRSELKSWHKGRIALLGDAAHPTSPHLGQGANQAFEDIYHLVRLLRVHKISPTDPIKTSDLEATFREYEELRIARTSLLVQGARSEGENVRVVKGHDACIRRDEAVAAGYGPGAKQRVALIGDHPFKTNSEL